MLYRFILTIMCIALISGIAFGEPNMQDGMWEISVKAEMPGMTMEMPPIKFNQCLTKKDYVPQQKGRNEDCKIVSTRIDGDTVTWVVQCRMKEGTTDSTGKITYQGNSFDGIIKAVINNARSGKMEMTQHMTGHRTGDCK